MISALLNSRRETTPTGGKFYDLPQRLAVAGRFPCEWVNDFQYHESLE